MMDAWKDLRLVLKVVERGEPAAVQSVGEECRGGCVGGQTRGSDDPHPAFCGNDRAEVFGEDAECVDLAASAERVAVGRTEKMVPCLTAPRLPEELVVQRWISLMQFSDLRLSHSGIGRV